MHLSFLRVSNAWLDHYRQQTLFHPKKCTYVTYLISAYEKSSCLLNFSSFAHMYVGTVHHLRVFQRTYSLVRTYVIFKKVGTKVWDNLYFLAFGLNTGFKNLLKLCTVSRASLGWNFYIQHRYKTFSLDQWILARYWKSDICFTTQLLGGNFLKGYVWKTRPKKGAEATLGQTYAMPHYTPQIFWSQFCS
jgi:hypothetical protein